MTAHTLAELTDRHDISGFRCGETSIDRYLANEALSAQASGEARTHVWLGGAEPRVLGYFTIMPTMVEAKDLPRAAWIGRDKQIPGYLIAKLGLDQSLRRKGLGTDLLVDALTTVVRAADAAGGRVIVVDTLQDNKVHDFYCAADFLPIDGTYRVWMKVSTAREAVGPGPA